MTLGLGTSNSNGFWLYRLMSIVVSSSMIAKRKTKKPSPSLSAQWCSCLTLTSFDAVYIDVHCLLLLCLHSISYCICASHFELVVSISVERCGALHLMRPGPVPWVGEGGHCGMYCLARPSAARLTARTILPRTEKKGTSLVGQSPLCVTLRRGYHRPLGCWQLCRGRA
jgi:hypothetical protein